MLGNIEKFYNDLKKIMHHLNVDYLQLHLNYDSEEDAYYLGGHSGGAFYDFTNLFQQLKIKEHEDCYRIMPTSLIINKKDSFKSFLKKLSPEYYSIYFATELEEQLASKPVFQRQKI